MQGTRDVDEHAGADDGEPFDPREAAQMLAEAQRDARRHFDLSPPLVTAAMAVMVLGAYLALYLSTRDQHPYRGPSTGVVGLVYAVVAVSIVLSASVCQQARAGVSGPSVRRQRVERLAIVLSYLGSPLIQGAMAKDGASNSIAYGVIPAAGPLIIVGTTVVGLAASRQDQALLGAALIAVIGGFVALFVGPSGAWLAAGAGLFVAVAAYTTAAGRSHPVREPAVTARR